MHTAIKIKDLPLTLIEKMQGPIPREDFVSNGCTCSPDIIGSIDLRPACLYHDFGYSLPGDERLRHIVDREFYRNLRTCGLSPITAFVYFWWVRVSGHRFYTYRSDLVRPDVWDRLRLPFAAVFGG